MQLSSISALVITHLTPRRIASLKEVLKRRAGASPQLEVYLSNPALQALRSNLSKFIRATYHTAALCICPLNSKTYVHEQRLKSVRAVQAKMRKDHDCFQASCSSRQSQAAVLESAGGSSLPVRWAFLGSCRQSWCTSYSDEFILF